MIQYKEIVERERKNGNCLLEQEKYNAGHPSEAVWENVDHEHGGTAFSSEGI